MSATTSHVGNDVIFANAATLGGHCEIGDFVFIGGMTVLQQFTRVGAQVMIGGMSGLRDDVIPYGLANGIYAQLSGLNIVGMRRRKFTKERLDDCALVLRRSVLQRRRVRRTAGARAAARPRMIRRSPRFSAFIDDGKARGGRHRSLCMPRSGARADNDVDRLDSALRRRP